MKIIPSMPAWSKLINTQNPLRLLAFLFHLMCVNSVHARLVEIDQYTKSLEIIGVFVPFDVCEIKNNGPCGYGFKISPAFTSEIAACSRKFARGFPVFNASQFRPCPLG